MRSWQPILVALIAASCGPAGKRPRCDSEADCKSGLHCYRAVRGERGVCTATPCPAGCATGLVCADDGAKCATAYAVSIDDPAANSVVGVAGKAITASLTLGASGLEEPSSLELLADGDPAGTLGHGTRDALRVSYSGTYVPAAGKDGPVSLQVVAARDRPEAASSAPLQVNVDARPPTIASARATCDSARCLRDGVLTLTATVTDLTVVTVTASLDLDDFAKQVPLAPAGQDGAYSGELALKDWPFKAFERQVIARVRAVDAAGNETVSPGLPGITVTRLRWTNPYSASAAITSPAVASDPGAEGTRPPALADGTLIVGVSQFTDQLRAVRPDGTEARRKTLETNAVPRRNVSSAPSLGATAIWVGGDDGVLYGVDASRPSDAPVRCLGSPPAAEVMFTPALTTPPQDSPEVVYAFRADGLLYAAGPDGTCHYYRAAGRVSSSPVLVKNKIYFAYVVEAAGATPTVRLARSSEAAGTFGLESSVALSGRAGTCTAVAAPLAVDSAGSILVACDACGDTRIYKVDKDFAENTPDLGVSVLADLAGVAAESIVLFPDGDLLVGTDQRMVYRLSPHGGTVWSRELPGAVTGVVVAVPDTSGVTAYAVTSDSLFALDAAGATVWSGSLAAAPALRSPTIAPPPPGAPATALPTLHAGSAALHAVIVDTGLDPASPWPKAHHDLRNTNNWDAPLP